MNHLYPTISPFYKPLSSRDNGQTLSFIIAVFITYRQRAVLAINFHTDIRGKAVILLTRCFQQRESQVHLYNTI
jgi:hypothetical protein